MKDMHIDPQRLQEMARLHTVVEEKEWPHLRNCTQCMERFTQYVHLVASDESDKLSEA